MSTHQIYRVWGAYENGNRHSHLVYASSEKQASESVRAADHRVVSIDSIEIIPDDKLPF